MRGATSLILLFIISAGSAGGCFLCVIWRAVSGKWTRVPDSSDEPVLGISTSSRYTSLGA